MNLGEAIKRQWVVVASMWLFPAVVYVVATFVEEFAWIALTVMGFPFLFLTGWFRLQRSGLPFMACQLLCVVIPIVVWCAAVATGSLVRGL